MSTPQDEEKQRYLQYYQHTASDSGRSGHQEEVRTTPLFSLAVKHIVDGTDYLNIKDGVSLADKPSGSDVLPQYGLLGFNLEDQDDHSQPQPIMLNTNAPNSAFICGSQGSGKSHTLSCMLENCLLKDDNTGTLQAPIKGVVFHYDIDGAGSTAEAARLCSRGIKVRVLVSRSNYHALKPAYEKLEGAENNLKVVPLLLQDHQVTVARMNKLMAFSETEGHVPLYMSVTQRILRGMALAGNRFTITELETKIHAEINDKGQTSMMNLRLELMKSFCAEPARQQAAKASLKGLQHPPIPFDNVFNSEPGTLTIIDLSDPFVDASTVCVLFDICLNIIKENCSGSGLVVGLDEAHKYLDRSSAAATYTDHLLTTIREQRHNATRVLIATQEPTISEKLLDLCSVSIVHRFTSPAWFNGIKEHLAGASSMTRTPDEQKAMFERIVDLKVGESLVFSPSSYMGLKKGGGPEKLGSSVMKMKTRMRIGADGGRSVLAVARDGGEGDRDGPMLAAALSQMEVA